MFSCPSVLHNDNVAVLLVGGEDRIIIVHIIGAIKEALFLLDGYSRRAYYGWILWLFPHVFVAVLSALSPILQRLNGSHDRCGALRRANVRTLHSQMIGFAS